MQLVRAAQPDFWTKNDNACVQCAYRVHSRVQQAPSGNRLLPFVYDAHIITYYIHRYISGTSVRCRMLLRLNTAPCDDRHTVRCIFGIRFQRQHLRAMARTHLHTSYILGEMREPCIIRIIHTCMMMMISAQNAECTGTEGTPGYDFGNNFFSTPHPVNEDHKGRRRRRRSQYAPPSRARLYI